MTTTVLTNPLPLARSAFHAAVMGDFQALDMLISGTSDGDPASSDFFRNYDNCVNLCGGDADYARNLDCAVDLVACLKMLILSPVPGREGAADEVLAGIVAAALAYRLRQTVGASARARVHRADV